MEAEAGQNGPARNTLSVKKKRILNFKVQIL